MKKQSGFTLIELVVVIVIIGILAVAAAPKLLNIQDDARTAALKGLKAALQGASALVHAKASVAGKERLATAQIDVGGEAPISLKYGYPEASSAGIEEAIVGMGSDWKNITHELKTDITADNTAYFTLNTLTVDGTTNDCYVSYHQDTAARSTPTITLVECDSSNLGTTTEPESSGP